LVIGQFRQALGQFIAGEPADAHDLVAAGKSAHQGDLRPPQLELFCQELFGGDIGGIVLRRLGDRDLQRFGVFSDDSIARRAGNDPDGEMKRIRAGTGQLNRHRTSPRPSAFAVAWPRREGYWRRGTWKGSPRRGSEW